jgi:hypothetical protein
MSLVTAAADRRQSELAFDHGRRDVEIVSAVEDVVDSHRGKLARG